MKLYHATTQKKAKQYRQSGAIHAPVRGFTTMQAAMAWAMKVINWGATSWITIWG